MPSPVSLTDTIWQVCLACLELTDRHMRTCSCDHNSLDVHTTTLSFFCSYPEGFGCVAQKAHNSKALSRVFATKTRHSAHPHSRADFTTGMRTQHAKVYLCSSLKPDMFVV